MLTSEEACSSEMGMLLQNQRESLAVQGTFRESSKGPRKDAVENAVYQTEKWDV